MFSNKVTLVIGCVFHEAQTKIRQFRGLFKTDSIIKLQNIDLVHLLRVIYLETRLLLLGKLTLICSVGLSLKRLCGVFFLTLGPDCVFRR